MNFIIHKIDLSGIILKPNMIQQEINQRIKSLTKRSPLKNTSMPKKSVPNEVPGIAFLSGGQSEMEATENLNLININNDTNFIMTYSYGRGSSAKCFEILVKKY